MAPETSPFTHLKSLTQLAPPADLERAVRRRFSEPRRLVLPAVAALVVAAAALAFFANGHGADVASAVSVPASSPIVSAAQLSSGQATAFSITVRADGSSHETARKAAQPAASFMVEKAGITVFVGLKPGTTVSSVNIAADGRTYPGQVSQARNGVDVTFPVNALPKNWVMRVVLGGRVWIVRPSP